MQAGYPSRPPGGPGPPGGEAHVTLPVPAGGAGDAEWVLSFRARGGAVTAWFEGTTMVVPAEESASGASEGE